MKTYLKDLRWGKFNLIEGDTISNIASHYGEWAEVEVTLFRLLLEENSNIIEVGANIGLHTVPLAKIAHQGNVLAFEPQRIIFQQLCCNLALNNLTHVKSYLLGVSHENTQCIIESCDYNEAWNYGSFSLQHGFSTEKPFQGYTYQEQIDVIKLDDFPAVQQLQSLALLKIDAEGLDLKILQGAKKTITQLQPAIFIEIKIDYAPDILEYLTSLDYIAFWAISERYQTNNFYHAERNEFGFDLNFLALPRHVVETVQPCDKLATLLSVLQPVKSIDDFINGHLNWLINVGEQ